jgi:hypothetical protein
MMIAWDRHNEATVKLATCTRGRCLQVWSYNNKDLQATFSVQLQTTVPSAIAFTENQGGDLYVAGIYAGTWFVLPNLL